MTDAILEQVWQLPRGESDFVTVVVPELFASRSLLEQVRHPRELALKLRLLSEPGRRRRRRAGRPRAATRPAPTRLIARVLVSGVNAASMRAVNYAQTLDIDDVRAVHFAFSREDAREIERRLAAPRPADPARGRRCPVPRCRPRRSSATSAS